MIKPFQIVWELIEFGLQALFLYVLALLLCIAAIAYVIIDKKQLQQQNSNYEAVVEPVVETPIQYGEKRVEEKVKGMRVERECNRIAGCRVLEDGTIEW